MIIDCNVTPSQNQRGTALMAISNSCQDGRSPDGRHRRRGLLEHAVTSVGDDEHTMPPATDEQVVDHGLTPSARGRHRDSPAHRGRSGIRGSPSVGVRRAFVRLGDCESGCRRSRRGRRRFCIKSASITADGRDRGCCCGRNPAVDEPTPATRSQWQALQKRPEASALLPDRNGTRSVDRPGRRWRRRARSRSDAQ